MKFHGEIATKGLTNYVYDDDNSAQFPSREHSVSEQACASKETKAKEEIAKPKIIGSLKQDHWILDKKNEQLTRARRRRKGRERGRRRKGRGRCWRSEPSALKFCRSTHMLHTMHKPPT